MRRLFMVGITLVVGAWAFVRSLITPSAPLSVQSTVEATMRAGDSAGYVSDLPDYGPAPELTNEAWLNTDTPLRLNNLRGKVVLLDMWTFDCINCIHIIPSVRQWHDTYADQGLVVIGNHYPEFDFEHDLGNLREALVRLDVPYAVAQDNNAATWRAYGNQYWPTIYLIDKHGHIRYYQIGEGGYERSEAAIRDLLAETYTPPTETPAPVELTSLTPTTDLNVRSGAGENYAIIGAIKPGESFVVRGQENGWYRIGYNDDEGYVSSAYVTVNS